MFTRSKRLEKGQAMVVLGLLIAVFVIFIIGLFGFEVNRVEVAREQLRTACEAAALSAAATLASQDSTDPVAAQTLAMNTGLASFQKNQVVGWPLTSASLTYSMPENPGAGDSQIYIQFLDPHNNNTPVSIGDPRGKIVNVNAALGLQPAFGSFLGLPVVSLRTSALSGVPNLDVILCFDVSGSIDDQTPVTFVKRAWNSTQAKNTYTVPSTRSGSPVQPLAQGNMYNIIGPPATGSRVNGVYPQYLSTANQSDHRWKLSFSGALRGSPNAGSAPGNYPPGTASTGDAYTFTDMIVNIDGRSTFAGLTSGGFSFPNLATVVEASRGNLENGTVFASSKANASVPSTIVPQVGYQAKYIELARQNLHPIYDAQVAAQEFFTIMNTNTDAHFGWICFSDNAGTSATYTYRDNNIDASYSAGGTGNFPVPNISLDNAVNATNYDAIQAKVFTTQATTSTNIGDAVYKAVQQLTSKSRAGSKKAIVLFTDGMPTTGGPLNSDPWTNARQAAVRAKNAGIPIYTIGLAQNSEIIPQETAILNDTNSSTTSGGMAAIAGNGGKFFLVTNVDDLRKTFENIARQLVQLVH